MTDTAFLKLKNRVDDIYSIAPSDLHSGVLTDMFRQTTGSLKFFPFKIIIPVSVITAFFLYIFAGFLVVRLVSLLQFGF